MSTSLGADLAALALDEVHRLGEVRRFGGRVAVVLGDRAAGVDRDDVGACAGQPNAMRTSLPAGGPCHVGDLARKRLSSAMVDIVRVVNDVVQVIDRDRCDRELTAVAAQPAPRPRVGGHVRVGVGHRVGGVDEFGATTGGSWEP